MTCTAVKSTCPKRTSIRSIGLLTPNPVDQMRPGTMQWVKDLQALMANQNYRLSFFHGHRNGASDALARLVRANPMACWLLANSSEAEQRWFASEGVPTVIAGSCHHSVPLPDVDLDFFALGRHVAARLAAFQHKRVVLFLTNGPGYLAGEVECERGLAQIFQAAGGELVVAYHERTRDSVVQAIRRHLVGSNRPTAFVMNNSLDYLAATSFLAQQGFRVPEDISVVARNHDAILDELLPTSTCYRVSPHIIARKIFKLIMQAAENETPFRPNVRIMPDFLAGSSLSWAPGLMAECSRSLASMAPHRIAV